MELTEIYGLLSTPFGLALVALFVSDWLINKFSITKKVLLTWIVGIVLSVIMLLLGKFANYGAYAEFTFKVWQDFAIFTLVAISPALISNGIYDSKLLEKILDFLRK